MAIRYEKIDDTKAAVFHELMVDYYRDAEDLDTPQAEIDGFIGQLFGLIASKSIGGRLVYAEGDTAAGFVLWMIDRAESDFSEMPGYGTILEIGLKESYRHQGIGKAIVDFAEARMKQAAAAGFYVLAYGPAQAFWRRRGYSESHRTGTNGLPLLTKPVL